MENPTEDGLYQQLQSILLKNAEKLIGVGLEEYEVSILAKLQNKSVCQPYTLLQGCLTH